MIDLEAVVWIVLKLLGCGAVLGILWFLINYIEDKFPSYPLFWKVIRVVFVLLVCLLAIFIIISFINGTPLFRWGRMP